METRICKECRQEKSITKFSDPLVKGVRYTNYRCNRCIDHYKNYGIRFKDYLKILIDQEYRCGICRCDLLRLEIRNVHIDHDHITGIIRGILCTTCNTGLEHMFRETSYSGDSPHLRERAIEYLKGKGYGFVRSSK